MTANILKQDQNTYKVKKQTEKRYLLCFVLINSALFNLLRHMLCFVLINSIFFNLLCVWFFLMPVKYKTGWEKAMLHSSFNSCKCDNTAFSPSQSQNHADCFEHTHLLNDRDRQLWVKWIGNSFPYREWEDWFALTGWVAIVTGTWRVGRGTKSGWHHLRLSPGLVGYGWVHPFKYWFALSGRCKIS